MSFREIKKYERPILYCSKWKLIYEQILSQIFRNTVIFCAELYLKVHKNENFFGFDFEFCTILLLVMSKY
jgi:hypothetical protein